MKKLIALFICVMSILPMTAEDGHSLWLRMAENATPAKVELQQKVQKKGAKVTPATIAVQELKGHWKGAQTITVSVDAKHDIKADGYAVDVTAEKITIKASTASGALYAAYDLLRKQETGARIASFNSAPKYEVRILNHWDNPNGTVERGFAGRSIFWCEGLSPKEVYPSDDILKEYARANASIGINATVLNNVNAKPLMLSSKKIKETKRIADALRPYGMKVYLAVNFASPKALGGLPTADPLDKKVRMWWKKKADEIYAAIPDFGGFLVKANSEGEPGPMDYDRTHVDGANMLAEALAPHHGIVMWRAFVYSPKSNDRASQAYDEFMPFDGQFADNVIIQVKNGPVDFQPREPVSPLFLSLKNTPMMAEFQITQEYLGESIHTAFLATMWREFFDTVYGANDNYKNSTSHAGLSAISAVANIGNDRNWCGSDMAQANWYAFGRLAWDDTMTSEAIADEWLRMTYVNNDAFVAPVKRMLLQTRETVVRYMMPLGIHHIFAGGHHYGPEPWYAPKGLRADWTPPYYHKADANGIGFDRTVATGSANTAQYPAVLREQYDDINKCPENLLLWFHHASWNHKMHNGETVWDNLCHTYDQGVREAEAFVEIWKAQKQYVDAERYAAQLRYFDRQAKDAWWWRDACLLYFQQFSKQQFPIGSPAPRHTLDALMKYHLDMDMYHAADVDKLP